MAEQPSSPCGTVQLLSGFSVPAVGLGLWKSKAGDATAAVRAALESGVRLLDGAANYGNELGVGEGLRSAITDGVVRREDVIVVSKLFNTHHVWEEDASRVHAAIDKTLKDLQLAYVDLYLMHWPFAFEQMELDKIGGLRKKDGTPNPKLIMKMEFLDTYAEMLKLVEAGKARTVGVCNFTSEQIQTLLERFPDSPPAVNQVELHPYLVQPELTQMCQAKGIQLMAYSPLGSGDSYSGRSFPAQGTGPYKNPNAGTYLLENPVVGEVAAKLQRTPAQVLIRWSVQHGFICIPKSARAERIRENADVLGWTIPDEEMVRLDALDCNFRYGIGYQKGHYDCPNAPWSKI